MWSKAGNSVHRDNHSSIVLQDFCHGSIFETVHHGKVFRPLPSWFPTKVLREHTYRMDEAIYSREARFFFSSHELKIRIVSHLIVVWKIILKQYGGRWVYTEPCRISDDSADSLSRVRSTDELGKRDGAVKKHGRFPSPIPTVYFEFPTVLK